MAWDKNNDVLGQIFDFIFAQQKLPPDKRKPVNATGVSGDKELIDAVAAILENPAKFNVENIADNYADAVNIKLAELRFSEDNIKKAEVGISNLADIVTDPVGYARKVRDTTKAIRKSMRAKYLGAQSVEFVVSAYLRKQGFSKELRDIIKNDIRFRDSIKQLYEFSDYKEAQAYAQAVAQPPMLSGVDKEYLNAREAKLKAKMSMSNSQWDSLSNTQRSRLTNSILTNEADGNTQDIERSFQSILGQASGSAVYNRYLLKRGKKYSNLESSNLGRQAGVIRKSHFRNNAWDSESSRLVYERTKVAKDFINNSEAISFISGRQTSELLSRSRKYFNNIDDQITDIKNDLESARRRGNSSQVRVLKEQLKMTKSARSTMLQVAIVGNIGMVEGYFNSIKDYWNLPSILKGDFFNPRKNQFNSPTEKIKFQWDDGKVISEIMIPAHYERKGRSRNITKAYDEFFSRIYYMTPASIFKTYFYNGEGFAWRAFQQKKKIEKYIKSVNLSGFNLDQFSIDSAYRDSILSGARGITNQKLLDMLKKYERQGQLAKMFSSLYRLQEEILTRIDKGAFKAFREKIYQGITNSRWFLRITDGTVATGLLKKWAKDGGLRNLIKGLSQAIADVFGITVGPALNLLIGAVVGWVAERLYDFAVPLFGIIVFSLFGLIGVFVMTYGLVHDNLLRSNISASTPPGSVEYCQADDIGFEESTTEFYGTDIHVPPPINSSCPLGEIAYVCTQGFTDTTCTHARMKQKKPVDIDAVGGNIQYFYAPQYCDSSNCTASTVINPARCSDGNYVGQWVTFNDGHGNVFTLGHTKFIPPSNGKNYSAGEPVAYVYQSAAELIADDPQQITSGTSFFCWTGSHIHLLITQNGTPIDPLSFLYEMGCVNGPSSESACPPCRS